MARHRSRPLAIRVLRTRSTRPRARHRPRVLEAEVTWSFAFVARRFAVALLVAVARARLPSPRCPRFMQRSPPETTVERTHKRHVYRIEKSFKVSTVCSLCYFDLSIYI